MAGAAEILAQRCPRIKEDMGEHEEKGVPIIHVKTDTDEFTMKGRPCELSAMAFVPTHYVPQRPLERTYFNTPERTDHYGHSTYDRMFKQDLQPYNNKLHRDDRAHAKSRDLQVNKEEVGKVVPSLSSSVYGHRLDKDLDPPQREHVRIAHVRAEFLRRNGPNLQETNSLKDL